MWDEEWQSESRYSKDVTGYTEWAEWLISKQMVDYLGSDLHNSSHVLHINKYLSGKEYPKHMRNIHIKNNHL